MPYKDPEARREYRRKYYWAQPEKCREASSRWARNNRTRRSRVAKEYRRLKGDEIRARELRWREKNRDKLRSYGRKQREKHKAKNAVKAWKRHIRDNYGIGCEEYAKMLERQGGVCAICGSTPKRERLHIDHDHATGEVRGLLCRSCNLGIGNFRDEERVLIKAAEYISAWRKKGIGHGAWGSV